MAALIRLRLAAQRLRVPFRWLEAEAAAGRVPALDAGGRWVVDLEALEAALLARARDRAPQSTTNTDGPGLDPRAVAADTGAIRAAIAGECSTRADNRHARAPSMERDDDRHT